MRTGRIGFLDIATRSQVVSLCRAGLRPPEICERLGIFGDSDENAVRQVWGELQKRVSSHGDYKSKTPGVQPRVSINRQLTRR